MQAEMLDSTVSSNSQALSNASSALKLFENPLFKVRVIMRCADPWFVAKDVATCIEHKDVSTMCRLCRDKDKVVESASNFDSNDLLESGNARITLISESGLYRILAKCNLPKCEPFESWVFDEVLPSIRKTGSYSVAQNQPMTLPNFCNPAEAARAWADLYEKNQATELRALTAESERDEAIRTKAQIGSRRELLRLRKVIGHDILRRIGGELSNQIVPIVGRLSYCPATRNERNSHAHSKPLFE